MPFADTPREEPSGSGHNPHNHFLLVKVAAYCRLLILKQALKYQVCPECVKALIVDQLLFEFEKWPVEKREIICELLEHRINLLKPETNKNG